MWEALAASTVTQILTWLIGFAEREVAERKQETVDAQAREYRIALDAIKRAEGYRKSGSGGTDLIVRPGGSAEISLPGQAAHPDRDTPRDPL